MCIGWWGTCPPGNTKVSYSCQIVGKFAKCCAVLPSTTTTEATTTEKNWLPDRHSGLMARVFAKNSTDASVATEKYYSVVTEKYSFTNASTWQTKPQTTKKGRIVVITKGGRYYRRIYRNRSQAQVRYYNQKGERIYARTSRTVPPTRVWTQYQVEYRAPGSSGTKGKQAKKGSTPHSATDSIADIGDISGIGNPGNKSGPVEIEIEW